MPNGGHKVWQLFAVALTALLGQHVEIAYTMLFFHICLSAIHDFKGYIRHQIEEYHSCSIGHQTVKKGYHDLMWADHGRGQLAGLWNRQYPYQYTQ